MTATKEILDLNRFDPQAMSAIDGDLGREGGKTSGALSGHRPFCSTSARSRWCVPRAPTCTMPSGRRYLDVYNNVPSVGHCHPRVVDAIAKQAGVLNIHTRYLNARGRNLRRAAARHLSRPLWQCRLHLHRQRKQRSGHAHRPDSDRRRRIRRHRGGLSRQHRAGDRNLAIVPAASQARRLRAPRSGPANALAAGGDVGAAFAAEVEKAIAIAQGVRPRLCRPDR